jgi:hypothetical protein
VILDSSSPCGREKGYKDPKIWENPEWHILTALAKFQSRRRCGWLVIEGARLSASKSPQGLLPATRGRERGVWRRFIVLGHCAERSDGKAPRNLRIGEDFVEKYEVHQRRLSSKIKNGIDPSSY